MDIGIFPDVMKRGCITSIFKKGDSRLGCARRPMKFLKWSKRAYLFLVVRLVLKGGGGGGGGPRSEKLET